MGNDNKNKWCPYRGLIEAINRLGKLIDYKIGLQFEFDEKKENCIGSNCGMWDDDNENCGLNKEQNDGGINNYYHPPPR